MRKIIVIFTILTLLIMNSTLCYASEWVPENVEGYSVWDTNKDGTLSAEEEEIMNAEMDPSTTSDAGIVSNADVKDNNFFSFLRWVIAIAFRILGSLLIIVSITLSSVALFDVISQGMFNALSFVTFKRLRYGDFHVKQFIYLLLLPGIVGFAMASGAFTATLSKLFTTIM